MFYLVVLLAVVPDGHAFIDTDNSNREYNMRWKCKVNFMQPCEDNSDIKFYLYKRGKTREVLNLGAQTPPADFDPNIPLKVIIHGYSSLSFMREIVEAYLGSGNSSVLVVDWESLAQKPCYLSARLNTWQVGHCTKQAMILLRPLSLIHMVGFSLGAHIAGMVSSQLFSQRNIRVHRITGLDPALPLYATPLDGKKLDASDADFVDVIHTNPGIFGKAEPSGHLDFYINGHSIQPGCFNTSNPALCSHRRSCQLFADSIRGKLYLGTRCPSFWYLIADLCKDVEGPDRVLLGEYADPSKAVQILPSYICEDSSHKTGESALLKGPTGGSTLYSFGYLLKSWERGIIYIKTNDSPNIEEESNLII